MRKASIFVLAVFALITGALARDNYSINRIQVTMLRSPVYSLSTSDSQPSTSSQPKFWMQVEVDFKSYVEMTDELTVKYYIYLNSKCLTGEVTLVDVQKANNLYSVMYVTPNVLARLGKGKPEREAQEVGIQIFCKGELVAEKSMKGTPGAWWEKQEKIAGSIANKNETPFAPLYWDRYEAIKPVAH